MLAPIFCCCTLVQQEYGVMVGKCRATAMSNRPLNIVKMKRCSRSSLSTPGRDQRKNKFSNKACSSRIDEPEGLEQYTKPKAIERKLVVNNVTAAQHMVVKVYV